MPAYGLSTSAYGPARRRTITGVPADHFPPARSRFMAQDHRGRITALVADGDDGGCVDEHGEEFGATGGTVTDKSWDGSASRFDDDEYKHACAACDPDTGEDTGNTVKQRCFLPHHEPDGTVNENGVHSAAQRISSLSGHDAAAVERAKAHLRSHYSKDLKEDAPKSIGGEAASTRPPVLTASYAAELTAEMASAHEAHSGTHSHAHSAMDLRAMMPPIPTSMLTTAMPAIPIRTRR